MLTLYYHPDSANIVIHMLLEELGVDYQLYRVSREADEHRGEAFKRLNPQGLLPVLVDGEQPIFETAAIALYLCEKYQALMPDSQDPAGRVLPMAVLSLQYLARRLRVIFYTSRHVLEGDTPAEQSLRKQSQNRVLAHYRLIEQQLQKHAGDWMLGQQLTALDFYLAALCRWPFLYPAKQRLASTELDALPNLKAFLQRLESRASVVKAFANEGISAPLLIEPSYPEWHASFVTGYD